MGSTMDHLRRTADELDRLIRTKHPELHLRFRAGLSEDEVHELSQRLLPFHLPADLVTLYRWHDGWQASLDGAYRPLLPDATFNSLADAIAQYELWWGTLGSAGWHPLWFPAFGDQSGELVPLRLHPDEREGSVFAYHSELELFTSYDSVATLFKTTLECWQRRLIPYDPLSFPPEIRQVAARHNPLSRTPDGGYREEISRSSTEKWPSTWKEIIGVASMRPERPEAAVTIADFLSDPACGRPIRADVRPMSGSADWIIATAADATGAVTVQLTREATEHFRELARPGRYELSLTAHPERSEIFLVKRVVPL